MKGKRSALLLEHVHAPNASGSRRGGFFMAAKIGATLREIGTPDIRRPFRRAMQDQKISAPVRHALGEHRADRRSER